MHAHDDAHEGSRNHHDAIPAHAADPAMGGRVAGRRVARPESGSRPRAGRRVIGF
jgi:hypothetical protein